MAISAFPINTSALATLGGEIASALDTAIGVTWRGGEALTTLSYNVGTKTLSYVDENSATTPLDLSSLAVEALTSISYNAGTKVLDYTDENGAVTNIDLSGLAADIFVTGASYVAATGQLTLTDNDGVTPDIVVQLAQPATAVPSAHAAVPAIGASTKYAREDHVHGFQGVSVDAGNKIVVGTDDLHLFAGSDRVHATDTAVAPATAGAPTATEIAAAVTARDVVVYYTGDDLPASVPTYVFHVDAAGVATLLLSPAAAGGNIYDTDGSLDGARQMTMNGFDLDFQGSAYRARIGLQGEIIPQVLVFDAIDLDASIGTVQVVNNAYNELVVLDSAAPIVTVNFPGTVSQTDNEVRVRVIGILLPAQFRTIRFQLGTFGIDGQTAIDDLIVQNGTVDTLVFRYRVGATGIGFWVLVETTRGHGAGSNIYGADGTLTGARAVTMNGNDISFNGAGSSRIQDDGTFAAPAFAWELTVVGHTTGVAIVPANHLNTEITVTGSSTGNIVIDPATSTGDVSEFGLRLHNVDAVPRSFVFDAVYNGFDGATDIGTVVVAAGGDRHMIFRKVGVAGEWTLQADTDGFSAVNVTTQPLDYVAGVATANVGFPPGAKVDLADAAWSIHDPSGLIDTPNDQIIVAQDGIYSIRLVTGVRALAGTSVQINVNSVTVAQSSFSSSQAINSAMSRTVEYFGPLSAGDIIDFTSFGYTSNVSQGGTTFVVQQMPVATYVPAGALNVEDYRVQEGVNLAVSTGGGFTTTLDTGRTFNDLIAEYEYIEFEMRGEGTLNGDDWYYFSERVPTARLAEMIADPDGAVINMSHIGGFTFQITILFSQLTANVTTVSASGWAAIELRTFGVRPQKSVVSLTANPSAIVETITQAAHGFAVGEAVVYNGGVWAKARANSGATLAQGLVAEAPDANTFTIVTFGKVTATAHGLTVGQYYWLSQATAGLITATQPTSGIVQGVLHVRDANTLFINIGTALTI